MPIDVMTVELMLAREAVRATVQAYMEANDNLKYDELLSVFHPDAILEIPGRSYRGGEIRAFYEERRKLKEVDVANGRRSRHHATTQHIALLSEQTASASTYFILMRSGSVEQTGLYLDHLRVANGRWLIDRKSVIVEYQKRR